MPDRNTFASEFLAKHGWGNASRTYLAGDASNRSYMRLKHGETGESVVLMDAPPAQGEDIQPFIAITGHLRKLDLSAPRILAHDTHHGILLLEDLGDALFARLIEDSPDIERTLYTAAVDLLVELHQHQPPDGLLVYSPAVMAEFIGPVFEWYHPVTPKQVGAITSELELNLTQFCTGSPVMVLRDFHAENLLWLPERTGIKRVGLLDYQDAVKAHSAYDLISLLKDARRDVLPAIQTEMIDRYITNTNTEPEAFHAACCIQSVQRNLRILGIFARLSKVSGKFGYIDLIPRVWEHLKQDLSHPELKKLNELVFNALPEPTPKYLQRLKVNA